ncbi:transposable element Tcb2 transposase [Trichonephila clavipes]|nr:transposable element Tcb2 transposase [Trichonephila clavipes]
MTYHNHLDTFLKLRAVGKLVADQFLAEGVHRLQIARKWSTGFGFKPKQVVLSPGYSAKLTRNLVDVSRISRKTLYSRLAEAVLYAQRPVLCAPLTASDKKDRILRSWKHQSWTPKEWGYVLFRDESKFPRQSDSCRVFIWRKSGSHFHSSYITKIDRYRGTGILVCGDIMLDTRTPLYVFDKGALQSFMGEILEAYMSSFWVL